MAFCKEAMAREMASADDMICRDYGSAMLTEGKAEESAEWFSKAIQASPGNASLYLARSLAWEAAGKGKLAISDAGVGVILRPRVAAGFVRLSAAFEAQGRYADAVRACFLGMRCGDPSTNTDLGRRMARVREAGLLPPVDWTPIGRRERWLWRWLSFRGLLLRIAAEVAGKLRLGGAGLAYRICAGGNGFLRPPWPPGAISPALFLPR